MRPVRGDPDWPELRFRSLYRQSVPGSRINEDAPGLRGPCAWLVGRIHKNLDRLAGKEGRGADILSRLEIDIRRAFEAATAHLPGRRAARARHGRLHASCGCFRSVYGLLSPCRARGGQGDDLTEELRALERGDLLSGACPRVTTHDAAERDSGGLSEKTPSGGNAKEQRRGSRQ